MMQFAKAGSAVVLALALAACSSDKGEVSLSKAIGSSLKAAVAERRATPEPVVNMTAAQLAKINVPVLQINPLQFGGSNFLARLTTRSDSRGGRVEVWQSTDKAHILLNRGVLVGTRGVGNDIIASDASQTINAVTNLRSGSGSRTLQVSDGDGTASNLTLSCVYQNLGAAQISVAEQGISTTKMSETCTSSHSDVFRIENVYWVQSGGKIRKSKQWAGPAVGYYEMIALKG